MARMCVYVCRSSPNLAYNDDDVASYDDEDDDDDDEQIHQETDGRLNTVRTDWSTMPRYS